MRPSDPALNLKIVCRVRPSNDVSYCIFASEASPRSTVLVSPVPVNQTLLRSQTGENLSSFEFDHVITESSRQGEVFESLAETYVKDLLTGRSAAIVLFGPTGSGKSYTVRGGEGKERGLLLRAVEAFLYLSSKQRASYTLYAQATLVYEDKAVELSFSDSPIKRVSDLVLLLQRALRARKDFCSNNGDKNIKEKSHFLVSLSVMRDGTAISRLDVAELAGSEQAADRSIAASFNALSGILTRTGGNVKGNKLCAQLEPSLDIFNGYNPSQVLVICTVSPEKASLKHSLAAVKFASRIREALLQERSRDELLVRELTEIEHELDSAERPVSHIEVGRWITRREQRISELEGNAGSEASSTALLQACSNVRRKLEQLRENWLASGGQSPSRVTPKFETMPIKFTRSSSADRLLSPTPLKTERVPGSGQSQHSSFKESPITQTNSANQSETSIITEAKTHSGETKEPSSSPIIGRQVHRYDSSPRKYEEDKASNSKLLGRVETLLLDVETLEEAKKKLEMERSVQEARIRSLELHVSKLESRHRDGSRSPLYLLHSREGSSSPSLRTNPATDRFIQSKQELQEAKLVIKRLQTQLQEAMENVKNLSAELERESRDAERFRNLHAQMASKTDTLEYENSQLERLFDQMYHEKVVVTQTDLERSLQLANSTKQSVKAEAQALQQQFNTLQENMLSAKSELQKATETEGLLLERNQDLERDVKASEESVKVLERQIYDLKEELAVKEQAAEALEAALAQSAEAHKQELDQTQNRLLNDSREKNALSDLRNLIETQVLGKLEALETKVDGRLVQIDKSAELKESNAQLQQENVHLHAVNESLSAELQLTTEKLRSELPQKETKRLRDVVREHEETIYELKSKLIAVTTENREMMDSQQDLYRDKESYKRDLQEYQEKLDEEKNALEGKLRAIKKEADSSADKSQEAKAKLESMGMELTKARLETMHYQIENNQLMARLEAFLKPDLEMQFRKVGDRIEKLKELVQIPLFSPRATQFLQTASPLSDFSEAQEEELVIEQDEKSLEYDLEDDPKSLSGRLKNVFHTSLSSSFG